MFYILIDIDIFENTVTYMYILWLNCESTFYYM